MGGMETSGSKRFAHIGIPLEAFGFLQFWRFLRFGIFQVLVSLWTLLLCITGELAGQGSVAVAVGISDRWQVTRSKRHMTNDTWHVTPDIWHVNHETEESDILFPFCQFWYQCYSPQTLRAVLSLQTFYRATNIPTPCSLWGDLVITQYLKF